MILLVEVENGCVWHALSLNSVYSSSSHISATSLTGIELHFHLLLSLAQQEGLKPRRLSVKALDDSCAAIRQRRSALVSQWKVLTGLASSDWDLGFLHSQQYMVDERDAW